MSDADIAAKFFKRARVENVVYKSHGAMGMELSAVGSDYARGFLPAVLQGIQSEVRKIGRLRMAEYSKYSAH